MSYWEILKMVFTSKEGIRDLAIMAVGIVFQLVFVNKLFTENGQTIANFACFIVIMLSMYDLFSRVAAIGTAESEKERKAKQAEKHPKKKKK